ncbi:transposase [Paenibacillus algorifonticola]|uniref:transposase n=1 Tax=Paenibacillus algorifonticola TaxID=684063 RepID=UPI000944D79C
MKRNPPSTLGESVLGHIKGKRSFHRFSLRGLEKVHTEFGIVALAHNLLICLNNQVWNLLETRCIFPLQMLIHSCSFLPSFLPSIAVWRMP